MATTRVIIGGFFTFRQYTVLDVETTQLCAFFVRTSEDQEVKVDLDPLALMDVAALLLVIGDWKVLPGQLNIHRRPGEFVCSRCIQTSSRAPCHSCFGGSSGEGHFLVSDLTASHGAPDGLAASAAASGPVPSVDSTIRGVSCASGIQGEGAGFPSPCFSLVLFSRPLSCLCLLLFP